MAKTSRIADLEATLTKAQDAYYQGTPVMSDAEYDALADELKDLDPKNPALTRVGHAASDTRLNKVKHEIPMGSQSKVNSQAEFEAWAKKTGSTKFALQEKLDGLSVEVVYLNGKLTLAITRGDGEEGEDVTHTVSLMQNVKKVLPKFSGSLRGEILFKKSVFKAEFGPDGDYANPRNAAAGITRRKDPHTATDKLTVVYFDCIDKNRIFEQETDKIKFVQSLGLEAVPTRYVGLDNAIKWFGHYQTDMREQADYEMDGLVIKVNDIAKQEDLGEVDGRPRGQVAWKFSAETRKTVLKDIRWDVGLTGRITPVAVLAPVSVSGVTVTHATLHNVTNMHRLGVYKDAEVLVSRRGDVIPQVEEVLKPSKTLMPYPTACPACGKKVAFEGEFLVCPDVACPAKVRGNITKWIKVLDIENAGDAFVDQVVKDGLVKDPADLYTLEVRKLKLMQGMGEISAKKVIENISNTRELPLAKFLAALNIPNASESTFTALVNEGFDSLDAFRTAEPTDFLKVPGIGDTTARQVVSGLVTKSALIDKLLANGVSIKQKIVGKLTWKSFCFTGEIAIRRPAAIKLVEDMGGTVKSGVSRGLDFLVQASPTSVSAKSQKAKALGTKVIGQQEFFDLVEFSFEKLIPSKK